ncbi:GNAT family N-acetyltransferase [Streptomyces sp. VRA16 Mangrove soil]|uniref:GNAT family N-acetyltransferase n=1 Tax=Streptomyces sp. VRA16 Mangrove soil TaxID=2817434 RepID=UPI001A9CC2CC|nr:GNAT family N-acetyltransferase [Streptomyces sp. VRA16 Mangrove soil]MBO1337832.1 GNAT family N-acetyltransferase [Streptomyces sp. VRA16 Mangrove soil]
MDELMTLAELGADAPGHVRWAAQARPGGALGPGVRAWRYGSAVAVASPGVSGRDRMAVAGDPGAPGDAVALVRWARAQVGLRYRPFGELALLTRVGEEIPDLAPGEPFLWMETTAPTGGRGAGPRWLTEREAEAAGPLFDAHFPDSYARPGRPGVLRWAGVLDGGPEPLALAADAWSGHGCGLLAGVMTHPAARGRGLARSVCGFVLDDMVRRYGRAALMVNADNAPAIATYERLGMTAHRFTVARPRETRVS